MEVNLGLLVLIQGSLRPFLVLHASSVPTVRREKLIDYVSHYLKNMEKYFECLDVIDVYTPY